MNKIRKPINYLKKKYSMPKYVSEPLLESSILKMRYWKKDKTGSYINKGYLDSLGREYNDDRKKMQKLAKETAVVNYMRNKLQIDVSKVIESIK